MRQSFIKSRAPLEDNAHIMMQFKDGAVGTLWASAVNAGSMHQQKIRIVGSKASIEWWDEQPNQLRFEVQGEAPRILERGMGYLYQDAPWYCCSHPRNQPWCLLFNICTFMELDRGQGKVLKI